jgi:peptide/nickel transport system substrate-binding protein
MTRVVVARRFGTLGFMAAGLIATITPTCFTLMVATIWSATSAEARNIRWARSSDSLTLDPHSYNEGATHTVNHQIYEPLIIRDHQGKPLPALAESWAITSEPTVWEFKLRKSVTFHDGSPFTADDVIFSFDRARTPTSFMKALLTSIESMAKVDDHTLQIKTKGPNPNFPAYLNEVFILSKIWATKNNALKPQDFKDIKDGPAGDVVPLAVPPVAVPPATAAPAVKSSEAKAVPVPKPPVANFAALNANGTGPFMLVSREPDVKTVLKRNDAYWGLKPGPGQVPLEIAELTFLPIKSDVERVAALQSGDVDFVQDVPVQELQKLAADPKLRVSVGQENRSIFIGLNVGPNELKFSDVKGSNPLADKRVRTAISMAINRAAIQKSVMRGQSLPTGIIAPPGVNGYSKELDVIPPFDLAKAKALVVEAGFPDGFALTMHCPDDLYVNDAAICQAIVGQLAAVGIKLNLMVHSKLAHFALIQATPPDTDMYLLGRGVPTLDSHFIFELLHHTRTDKAGGWNATRYANPELDQRIDALTRQTDLTQRNQAIAQIWRQVQDEGMYVPLHIQTLAYAMKADIEIPVDVSNQPKLKFVKFKK